MSGLRSGGPTQGERDLDEQQMRARLRGSLFGEPEVPVRISRYLVLDKIGEGGLGVVYAAYDPELDRKVALKLMQPGRESPRAVQRMQREAQAMAQLSHPNVVAVHDVGAYGNGVFMAMDLVDGMTLSRWVYASKRSWQQIRDVLVSAGQGICAAHRVGIIHRDFKPANVLVDAEGRARVLDFGLARAAEADSEDENPTQRLLGTDLTQTGTVLGTPAYMAPEQFEGNADARSDQWGFCATAYEALYRQRPFSGTDAETLHACVLTGRVTPPPANAVVPAWVYKALLRGLMVDPAQRHESVDALLHALMQDKRSRRTQITTLAGAVVLAAATAGVTAFVMQPKPSSEARERVATLEREARSAAADGRYLYPPADEPEAPTAYARVVALEQLDGPVSGEAEDLAASLRNEFAVALVSLGDGLRERDGGAGFAADFYAAALVFDPHQPQARERSSMSPGEVAVLRTKAGAADFTPGELVGAAPLEALAQPDEQTRAEKMAALVQDHDALADSTSRRVERLLGKKRNRKRRTDAPAAAAPGEPPTVGRAGTAPKPAPRTAPKRDPAAAAAESKRGTALLRQGKYADAERAFRRALEADGRNTTALSGLSDVYFERGEFRNAVKYAERARNQAPKRARIRMQLGDAYFKVHQYKLARKEYEEAKKRGHKGADAALKRLAARAGD